MKPEQLAQQVAALAALEEPARRSLYLYVVNQQREVGRDEAAQEAGVSRTLAGFHLDRLVSEGLLEASFRRLSGRTGPGAGRPAKLYRRSSRQLEISLPSRSYELAARILATAVDSSSDRRQRTALGKAARQVGAGIGDQAKAKARAGSRLSTKRKIAGAMATLMAHGYEPEQTRGEIRLHNCPFHGLVGEHKELVCGMNLALIEGVVSGLDLPGVTPVLDPKPGMCCVSLRLGMK